MTVPLRHKPSPDPMPPYRIERPHQAGPLIAVSAHSGQDYPPEFLAASRLDPALLRCSEDSFVDELFATSPRLGIPLLAAHFPRIWCDANREAWELDPAMFEDRLPRFVNGGGPRVAAGLGTIARVATTGEAIYARKLCFAEAEARIRTCWQPFHDALAGLIAEARSHYGLCFLLDCHSMPEAGSAAPGVEIVLGDVYGTSCAPQLVATAEGVLRSRGYTVRRNEPYAGGFISRHYGRPSEGMHALQIEIARRLYMDEKQIEKGAGFARVAEDMAVLLGELVALVGKLGAEQGVSGG